LDLSRSIMICGKQLFGYFVSWLPRLFLKSRTSQGQISTSPQLKNQLAATHSQPMDPLCDHSNSCIGGININCDCWQAIVWVFCQLVAEGKISTALSSKPACCFIFRFYLLLFSHSTQNMWAWHLIFHVRKDSHLVQMDLHHLHHLNQ
jgi:hypothetical protein